MKLKVFIFDDDEQFRYLLSLILEKRGYEVLSYSEPLTCPVYLNRKCPCPEGYVCGDIFLTDINMPKMTGLDFIENQKRNGCKIDVQNIAVMSGLWTNADRLRAKTLGCQTFEKPFDSAELFSWLDACEKRIDPNRKLFNLP